MTVFVDTSALYAVLDRDDEHHRSAARTLPDLERPLLTHNYVVVEASALVQHRLGIAALRSLLDDLIPVMQVEWVDEELHRAGVAAVLAASSRGVSLVDWVSFALMRRRGTELAFAFDRDFRTQGFRTVP